jgi:hypothetical protein
MITATSRLPTPGSRRWSAGFCGLRTALLAKEQDPGRSVILLEPDRVGWAATSRDGGFCAASFTVVRPTAVSDAPEHWLSQDKDRGQAAGYLCCEPDATTDAARYGEVRQPEPGQSEPGDRWALQAPEVPGHAPERSFRRGTGFQQDNPTDTRKRRIGARLSRDLRVAGSSTTPGCRPAAVGHFSALKEADTG